MKLLAFDTSSTACSVALLNNGQISLRHEIAPMQQAKMLLPMIDAILASANVTINHLDAIAFGCGPGSFTGLRIAISAAQGLAYAARKPLISISSLAAMAQATYEELGWTKLLVATDARIQEVYWAAYEVQSDNLVKLFNQEQLTAPGLVKNPDNSEWQGVGNAWQAYGQQMLWHPQAIDSDRLPMATAILSLAKAKWLVNDIISPHEAMPVYLRDNVAQKMKSINSSSF